MRTPGFEPGTSSLSATRSNQLSYARRPKILQAMNRLNFGQGILSQASRLSTLIRDFQQVLLTSRPEGIDQTGMKHERNSVCVDLSSEKACPPRQALYLKSSSKNGVYDSASGFCFSVITFDFVAISAFISM